MNSAVEINYFPCTYCIITILSTVENSLIAAQVLGIKKLTVLGGRIKNTQFKNYPLKKGNELCIGN